MRLATARLLAPRVRVLLVHGPESADDTAEVIADLEARQRDGGLVRYVQADYTRLQSVAELTDDVGRIVDRLDVVINNAAMPGPPSPTLTGDGSEVTFQVDYLAPV